MAETAQTYDHIKRYGRLQLVERATPSPTPDRTPSVKSRFVDRYHRIYGELSTLMSGFTRKKTDHDNSTSLAEHTLGVLAIHRARHISAEDQRQHLNADMAKSGEEFGKNVFTGLNDRNRKMQWDQVIGLEDIWQELNLAQSEINALRSFRRSAERHLSRY